MTPRKRARVPKARDCPRGPPESAATPCRHVAMTADDTTPEKGQDSTELAREGFPMREATDEEIALALEEEKQKVRSAANDVSRALLNEDVPLTDETVGDLWKAADAVTALSRTLTLRVPEAHRVEERQDDTDC